MEAGHEWRDNRHGGMDRVWLVRHGRPAATWGGADPDPGLDETGRVQAQAACDALLALPPGARPGRAISSPVRRCRETAAPFSAAIGGPLQIDPAVAEIPTPPGVNGEARPSWLRGAMTGHWAGIEGGPDYLAWREAVVAALVRSGGAAVFTHYVAINAAVSSALGDLRVLVLQPDHASITSLDIVDGGLRVHELGREATTRVLLLPELGGCTF